VRDDQNYWRRVEDYLCSHSDSGRLKRSIGDFDIAILHSQGDRMLGKIERLFHRHCLSKSSIEKLKSHRQSFCNPHWDLVFH
jgi:hypothetical protein